jgi:hypothetical protein
VLTVSNGLKKVIKRSKTLMKRSGTVLERSGTVRKGYGMFRNGQKRPCKRSGTVIERSGTLGNVRVGTQQNFGTNSGKRSCSRLKNERNTVSVSNVDFLKAHIKISFLNNSEKFWTSPLLKAGVRRKKGCTAHIGTFSHFDLLTKNSPIFSILGQNY